ncbi:uncharacterized protein BT62DRAFT_932143 [Guyanagaster necrorhizus]|uniref:Uncharacterized protein n=1 Tax=Guyanagaster necrorhizus TaxID=856835 RepID=A0A9P8ASR7_9AGAR|nr:uncharacterized protein BT62DRAFT_932143 [Guyanagaster necrorhizus MCA 3950]KAG7446688.1 hypothetical protein BT62DRAFT_932143 [Guyanagaster necrorhizus MCA 3950]
MAETLEFEVDDTSPAISYYPFRDTFSAPNLTAGWNPYYTGSGFLTSLGETGEGTSQHISSLNGASLSIQWHGTGIELDGNVTNASYTITLDETTIDVSSLERSDTLLANITGLSSQSHNITLTAQIATESDSDPTGFLVFDKAVITVTPPTNASSSLNFTLQTITDSRINFNGEWSYDNGLGQAFRESNKAGDTAQVSFFGTSFLVLGTTSPTAGNYSVTVDDIQTFLSAKSSFTQDGSLLFYATGLDPDLVHNFEISNEDGSSLILPVGGLRSFSTVDPNPTASATFTGESRASGYPSGTIAALALGGILAFILLAALFFFLFVYRPKRRRKHQHQRQHKDEQWKKESEAGVVLDIAPLPKTHSRERRRDSDWSGLNRWKRDIEGTDGLGIDIVFRHSDSVKEDGDVDNIESPSNPQHTARSPEPTSMAQRNNKGKSRWFGKTDKEKSSPSFTIDLPLPPILSRSRSASRQGSDSGNAARQRSRSNSALSYLASLSSASFASRKSSNASSRSRDRLPVPRPKSHIRTSSQRPLLQYEAEALPRPTRLRPLPQPPRPLSDDRGSVKDYLDDAATVLGPSTSRTALRHRSPRSSEVFPLQTRPAHEEQQPLASTSEPVDYIRGRLETRPSLLNVRESSPFRIEFHDSEQVPVKPRKRRLPSGVASAVGHGERSSHRASGASRVRFEESEAASTNETSESDYPDSRRMTVDNASQDDPAPSSRPAFRLTPIHPMAPPSRVTSFLDLSGSSDASIRTHSNDNETLASSHRISSERQPTSRWSSTTAPSSHGHARESAAPSSPSSTMFPFPVSLPASSHHPTGHRLSSPLPRPNVPDDQQSTARVHSHPLSELAPLSPTDSVPLSVSELHFRQSVSDDAGERRPRSNVSLPALPMNMSLLPRHPPLPGHGTETDRT